MALADVIRRAKHKVQKYISSFIDTSSTNRALYYSNQRNLDRCQNGVLWAVFWNGSISTTHAWEFWYSTNDGETWTENTTGRLGFTSLSDQHGFTPDSSFFIDVDDFAHFVYHDRAAGSVRYRRGTPNPDRTSWTWSSPILLIPLNPPFGLEVLFNIPDVVAHKEGSGWVVHVVSSFGSGAAGAGNLVYYVRVDITSGGVITPVAPLSFLAHSYQSQSLLSPSIDFHHTGDGKTVSGGLPHLYVAWSAPGTGSGNGIRFRKATYSGGSWTWGTIREIDNTVFVGENSQYWLNCLYDGTRVIIGGRLRTSASSGFLRGRLWERNEIDTTTTLKSTSLALMVIGGSLTYDEFGNVYVIGQVSSRFRLLKWLRATDEITSQDITLSGASVNVNSSLKRGYSNGRIEFVYSDGLTTPHQIKFGGVTA